MLTDAHDARQKALAAVPADGKYHALGAPFCKGMKAKRLPSGGFLMDASNAGLIDKGRDRSAKALAKALRRSAVPSGLRVSKGGVQTIQRIRGMAPRVVT